MAAEISGEPAARLPIPAPHHTPAIPPSHRVRLPCGCVAQNLEVEKEDAVERAKRAKKSASKLGAVASQLRQEVVLVGLSLSQRGGERVSMTLAGLKVGLGMVPRRPVPGNMLEFEFEFRSWRGPT